MGGNAADNRLFIDAVLYRYRTGIPWRDLPARFGDWKIVHQRFSRWAKSGVFERTFQVAGERSRQRIHDDRRHHRARPSAQCRRAKKNGPQAIGRSRGGLTTKIHALVDALGNPVELMLTPGQAHDLACAEPLINNADPDALIGDKAYDADPFVGTLTQRGITPVIPPRPTAKPRGSAILRSTANATSSNASSIRSSTSAPSPPAMTNSPEIFSPECSWPPL